MDHDLAVLAKHVDDPQLLERSRARGRRIYAELDLAAA